MIGLFYITGAIALGSAALAMTRRNAMHSILYLLVTLLANAMLFYLLGSPLLAALQIIIYAGAIIVLFVFVIMMVNPPLHNVKGPTDFWLRWFGPVILVGLLAGEWFLLLRHHDTLTVDTQVPLAALSELLFRDWLVILYLVAFLLLVGLIGAFHFGRNSSC